MNIENRLRLSFAEIVFYLDDKELAIRLLLSRRIHLSSRGRLLSVAEIDSWLMNNIHCRDWPRGLVVDLDRHAPKRPPPRRDYDMRPAIHL